MTMHSALDSVTIRPNLPAIDASVSERYGICRRGAAGMEIIRSGRCVRIFNAHRDDRANWADAVKWAKVNPNTKRGRR